MSVNKSKPHLYVIPEDDADRQIANGFALHWGVDTRQYQVIPPPGGWPQVLSLFKQEYIPALRRNALTHLVLLIDFDGRGDDRYRRFAEEIPADLAERVYVLGPRDEPEDLKRELGLSLEQIGTALADDCAGSSIGNWGHDHLVHNEPERVRLADNVRPFLFR